MTLSFVMQNDYTCISLLSDMFELRVITSMARINWLAQNFYARNDLGSVIRPTLTL